MKALKYIRRKIVELKVLINRANSYIAILNSGMIFFIFLNSLKQVGININLSMSLPIFMGTFLILIMFGYIEDKLGFFRAEYKQNNLRNELGLETLKRVKEIEKLLRSK